MYLMVSGHQLRLILAPYGVCYQQCGLCYPLLQKKLANYHVFWFTDNQNVVRILRVGSKKPDLHAVAMVFNLTICYQIHLEPEWVPRETK